MQKLGNVTIAYLKAQVSAGAHAVKVFDSWVGALNADDYRIYIAPVMEYIFDTLRETGVPTIYFGVGAGHLLDEWNRLPVDVLGLDWRTSMAQRESEASPNRCKETWTRRYCWRLGT